MSVLLPPQSSVTKSEPDSSAETDTCASAKIFDCSVANCMTLLESNSFVYFAGYLLKRLYACHECSTCQNAVECTAANDAAASSAVFMSFKLYSLTSNLCVPSSLFVRYIQDCEGVFSFAISNAVHKPTN